MPLSNIFLWTMLILAGLLSYQLLASLIRAETRAARAARGARLAHYGTQARSGPDSYSRHTAAFAHYQASPANARRRGSQHGFMTVADAQDTNPSRFCELSFCLPYAGSKTDPKSYEKMAADSDCHHCA